MEGGQVMTRPVRVRPGFVWGMVVALLTGATPAYSADFVFDMPSDDRWHYPFNFTPGQRGVMSVFGAFGNQDFPEFNDRDGIAIVAWDTTALLDPGLSLASYDVCSVTVRLTNAASANWPIDLTVDDVSTFYGAPDPDPGRPIELFGAGFGPDFQYESWNEFELYEGGRCNFEGTICSNDPRDPFPFVYQPGTLAKIHVEDSVKGTQNEHLNPPLCASPSGICPFTPTPWAVGVPINYTPGQQSVPFDVLFDINLSLSDGAVRGYFQEQLRGGRVFVIVTTLLLADFMGSQSGYPTFFTKEAFGTGVKPGQLTIRLKSHPPGDIAGDGISTLEEVAVGLRCMDGPGAAVVPPPGVHRDTCLCAFDVNGDGAIDLRDFREVMREFTGG
jgi:hypothetical protein